MQPRSRNATTVARPVSPPAQKEERPAERPVEFSLASPEARKATVAGTFNNWDDKRTPMRKDAAGWKATLWLPPGRYEYKFVVDGQWLCDPQAKESAPNGFGTTNSVVVV